MDSVLDDRPSEDETPGNSDSAERSDHSWRLTVVADEADNQALRLGTAGQVLHSSLLPTEVEWHREATPTTGESVDVADGGRRALPAPWQEARKLLECLLGHSPVLSLWEDYEIRK
ncbi:hypothetical protein [Tautonia sociabilis]|uniref:Uncharacterized protein n=1 Tax=Tautonia sociabilis TaxID=2080755 RepID=A0A432MD62_9BACT|nr:hypothetical protein [Tautonia sociabilis]RUL81694.1 hypothetical protein TsocGM_24760 [Tautonia sociabilis]